VDFGISATADA